LKAKGRKILVKNFFPYPPDFIKEHKLEKRFQGHSFDIFTGYELVEIDDLRKHSKKNQKINDGIINNFVYRALHGLYPLRRLLKEEIVDSKGYLQPTAAQYLQDNLF
jgi:hypothetical protein